MEYVWVAIGSMLGGTLRFALGQMTQGVDGSFPWTTLAINAFGSFVIGCFGTLTLPGGPFEQSEHCRLFVMVGFCGGFTTFSSFSLQTFDMLRSGARARAAWNIGLSITLCLLSIAVGHWLAHHACDRAAISETETEELTA